MALSVVKRPIGLKISSVTSTGTYTAGSPNVTNTVGGLVYGDYIYIAEGEAQGFWYVNLVGSDIYELREYPTAPAYTFIGSGTLTWYDCDYVGNFNAVHNPIVYKLASTLWPTNSVDTARTVSSYANDLGYTKLTLSGTHGTTELEFVKVTFTGGTTEVYQVLTWYSTTVITINLPYRAGITFVSVQKYYSDYHARIKVYAGLSASHTLEDAKPYEELAEIKAIPDSSGVITVNINEILKSKIEILKNNLNLGSLPNSIDSFCQFYITYAEAYSYSEGGYTLLDYVGSYTNDSANADLYAINASMAFKNTYSGMMSEYVYLSGKPLKFLTPFRTPVLFATTSRTLGPVSQFFDISFINTISGIPNMKREVYRNGTIVGTYIDSISSLGVGVYRYELDRSVYLEDRIDLTLFYPVTLVSLSSFTNQGAGDVWTLGATPSITSSAAGATRNLVGSLVALVGDSITITFNVTISGGDFLEYGIMTSSFSVITSSTVTSSGTVNYAITVPSGAAYFYFEANPNGVPMTVTVNSISLSKALVTISETKTIEVDDSCGPAEDFIDLSWLNHLGGFDYWRFKALSDYGIDVESTTEASKNYFSDWPNSWGADADTIDFETSRKSRQTIVVRAENLSKEQAEDLAKIKTSPLVQIVNDRTDRRTVILDKSSFVYVKEGERLYSLTFNLRYTDLLPSQSL